MDDHLQAAQISAAIRSAQRPAITLGANGQQTPSGNRLVSTAPPSTRDDSKAIRLQKEPAPKQCATAQTMALRVHLQLVCVYGRLNRYRFK